MNATTAALHGWPDSTSSVLMVSRQRVPGRYVFHVGGCDDDNISPAEQSRRSFTNELMTVSTAHRAGINHRVASVRALQVELQPRFRDRNVHGPAAAATHPDHRHHSSQYVTVCVRCGAHCDEFVASGFRNHSATCNCGATVNGVVAPACALCAVPPVCRSRKRYQAGPGQNIVARPKMVWRIMTFARGEAE